MKNYKKLKFACYATNVSMSAVANISPVLFIVFRSLYGISYSMLGLLVVVNFVTQLGIDLAFSFFSHRFNIEKAVKLTPALTVMGLLLYAAAPLLFPNNVYIGLLLGTLIFSASAGFVEVLISPVIAAIPSDNPDREMSKLHSVYAWGVVGVIILSTLFLLAFGGEAWQYLALLFALIPLTAFFLFLGTDFPAMKTPERASGALSMLKDRGVLFCVLMIFLGGAAECTMAQWSSGYIERALGIDKVWGDIFGVALFGMMLGLGRSLYAKYGKHIGKVLFFGAVGATLCYATAALSGVAVIGLVACALTGLCTSMFWPGSLLVASDRYGDSGVFIFALMAAGGDFGASVGPQLVGLVADAVIAGEWATGFAANLGITAEQLGMKAGMLLGALFPLAAVFVYLRVMRAAKRAKKCEAPPQNANSL